MPTFIFFILLFIGEYQQHLCYNDPSCQPCLSRLPTCVGRQDGISVYINVTYWLFLCLHIVYCEDQFVYHTYTISVYINVTYWLFLCLHIVYCEDQFVTLIVYVWYANWFAVSNSLLLVTKKQNYNLCIHRILSS
jgi:hypothetical protein